MTSSISVQIRLPCRQACTKLGEVMTTCVSAQEMSPITCETSPKTCGSKSGMSHEELYGCIYVNIYVYICKFAHACIIYTRVKCDETSRTFCLFVCLLACLLSDSSTWTLSCRFEFPQTLEISCYMLTPTMKWHEADKNDKPAGGMPFHWMPSIESRVFSFQLSIRANLPVSLGLKESLEVTQLENITENSI